MELKNKLDAAEIKLKSKDEEIKEKEETLKEKNEEIKEKDKKLEDLEKQLGDKKNSQQGSTSTSTSTPSTGARANLQTNKETYTRLERITVQFSFENIPYSERYSIVLVRSNERSGNQKDVGESGTETFTPQPPGDYEIHADIYTGEEWVGIEKINIKVTDNL